MLETNVVFNPVPLPGAFESDWEVVGVACRMFLRKSFDAHRAAENYDRKEKQLKE